MRLKIHVVSIVATLWISMLLFPSIALGAAELEDGTYTADYLILKGENDSVSMANDYWEKPATVIVKNGKATVRVTINHSEWVTQFKVPGNGGYVDTKVIQTNKKDDKRVVEFNADISQPIISKIHVTVAEIEYDHDYTIRFKFKDDSFKLIKAAEQEAKPSATVKPTETPQPTVQSKPANNSVVSAAPTSSMPVSSVKPGTSTAAENGQSIANAKPQATTTKKETAVEQGGQAQEKGQSSTDNKTESDTEASSKPPVVQSTKDSAASKKDTDADNSQEAVPVAAADGNGGSGAGDTSGGSGGTNHNAEELGSDSGGQTNSEAQSVDHEQAEALGVELNQVEEASEDYIAAAEDIASAAAGKTSSGLLWWSPLIALLLLLAGGAYIWRRKAQEVSK